MQSHTLNQTATELFAIAGRYLSEIATLENLSFGSVRLNLEMKFENGKQVIFIQSKEVVKMHK